MALFIKARKLEESRQLVCHRMDMPSVRELAIATTVGAPFLDVVIPARLEREILARCLAALIPQISPYAGRIIIICNGEGAEELAEYARDVLNTSAVPNAEFVVCTTATPGKVHALNLGDLHVRGDVVMYLDADIILSSGAVSAVMGQLCATDAPRLSSPRPEIVPAKSWLTWHYSRVWISLPAVSGDVVGAGCYAVNSSGRKRWGQFPDAYPDDAYVRSQFKAAERVLARDGTFRITMPEGLNVVKVARRWAAGNAVLASQVTNVDGAPARVGASHAQNIRHLLTRPDLWRSLPAFALVWGLARSSRAPFVAVWRPIRTDSLREDSV